MHQGIGRKHLLPGPHPLQAGLIEGVQLLLRDRFAAIDDIRRVDCPVLVIAGDRDRVVPLPESRRLYDAMPSPKELVILAGDHNDIELLAGDDMIAAIVRFLRQVL